MKYDNYGRAYATQAELCDLLYQNPDLDISRFLVKDFEKYNQSVRATYADLPLCGEYVDLDLSPEEFHSSLQSIWYMPVEYQQLDIAQHILNLCQTEPELQRVGQELLLSQERNLFDLLRYLKYLVDVMKENRVIWGVGRGSSVASYVLFLLGVHKIDSMFYNLNPEEFLR